MVQNILFDLDETLLDFKRSESRALSNMLRHIGVEPTEKGTSASAGSIQIQRDQQIEMEAA